MEDIYNNIPISTSVLDVASRNSSHDRIFLKLVHCQVRVVNIIL